MIVNRNKKTKKYLKEAWEMNSNVEEITIPKDLQTYLNEIVDSKYGYKLGEPWKYSEESLGVVVPILRENPPDRSYITMYEVLDQLNMKDTGHINQVELQNNCWIAIFVRAGTIFIGKTQNRAAQYCGVYQDKKETIEVKCVQQTHGIRSGEKMEFGDIAPPSVTMNLMSGNQSKVWESVRRYGSMSHMMSITNKDKTKSTSPISGNLSKALESISTYPDQLQSSVVYNVNVSNEGNA